MQIIGPYLQVKMNFLLVYLKPIETVFGVDLSTCALDENGSVVEINLQCLYSRCRLIYMIIYYVEICFALGNMTSSNPFLLMAIEIILLHFFPKKHLLYFCSVLREKNIHIVLKVHCMEANFCQ